MNLSDVVNRNPHPSPWGEEEKIPWNEEGFSRRMLKEHLSQEHDAASRKFATIDCHVAWINDSLGDRPAQILDLGCGPGFYTSRLAKLGHVCTGIDFSPAAIEYAREQDLKDQTGCIYQLGDVRLIEFGEGFDLVMMVYGEFNTFTEKDAVNILNKARKALKQGGKLVLELNSYECLHSFGHQPPAWHSARRGLFSESPYLMLEESFWDEELRACTRRMYVIDALNGTVRLMNDNHRAYTFAEITALIEKCGFNRCWTQYGWPFEQDQIGGDFLLTGAEYGSN